MFQLINPKIHLIIVFAILFIFTVYYMYRKSVEDRNIGLIIISFGQGLIISVLFPNYILFAPIMALFYYIVSYNALGIWSVFKHRNEVNYDSVLTSLPDNYHFNDLLIFLNEAIKTIENHNWKQYHRE